MYVGMEIEIDDAELNKNLEDIQKSVETIRQAYNNLQMLGLVKLKKKEDTANEG